MTAPTTSPDSATTSGQVNPYGSSQISIWGGPGFRTVRTTKTGEKGIIGARRVDHEDAVDYGFGAAGIQYFLTDPDGLLISDVAGLTPVNVLNNDAAGGLAVDDRINGSSIAVSSAATHGLGISYQAQVWYAPFADYFGADALSYTVKNDGAQTSAAAVVTITVEAVGGARQPLPLAFSIERDQFVTISATQAFANDGDLSIQALEVSAPPAHGTAEVFGSSVTYTPETGFTGADVFSWRMLINGVWSASGQVAMTIAEPAVVPSYTAPGTQIIHPAEAATFAAPPVVYATPDAANVEYNTPAILPLLENDLPRGGVTLQGFTQPTHGTVADNGDGTVTYTPQPGYTGPDTFNYTISNGIDARSALVTLMVLSPQLVAGQNFAATIGVQPAVINVLGNDLGTGLFVSAVSNPPNGRALILSGGRVQYEADLGFVGDEQFFYTTTDEANHTANGMLTVTVLAPPLVVESFSAVTPVGTGIILPVLDHAIGSGVQVTGVSAPVSGEASASVSGGGSTVTYVPQPTFAGEDSFTVTVKDAYAQTATAKASVFVQAEEQTLAANPIGFDATAGVLRTLTPLDNDTGTGLRIVETTSDSAATVTIIDTDAGPGTALNYTAPPSFSGPDVFDYMIEDAAGARVMGTITVAVAAIPFLPAPDTKTTDQDVATTLTPLANDGGTNPTLVAVGATDWSQTANISNATPPVVANDDPSEGTWTATVGAMIPLPVIANDTPASDNLIIKAGTIGSFSNGGSGARSTDNKSVNYTAANAGTETFQYIATDGPGREDSATVTVHVSAAPPVVKANPDPGTGNPAIEVTVGQTKAINVLLNDVGPVGLFISAVDDTTTAHGSAEINANKDRIRYTGESVGTDVFNYTISDTATPPHTSIASVTVTVKAGVAVVTAQPDSGTGFAAVQDTDTLMSPLNNDLPVANRADMRIQAGSLIDFNHGGSARIATNGKDIIYRSAPTFKGTETFKYTATLNASESQSTISVVVTEKPADDNGFAKLTPTIGLTTTGGRTIIRPTGLETAAASRQLKNLQTGNADADYTGASWRRIDGVDADFVTLDLRDRKVYHHSLVVNKNAPSIGQAYPGKKSPIRPLSRNGLCIYGAEMISERLLSSATFTAADYLRMKSQNPAAMDDNGILFKEEVKNGEILIEHCIFRGQFDGLNTHGSGKDTNCLYKIRECYAEEIVDEFMENNSIQRLWFEGLLVDGCNHFLSMAPGENRAANPPDYSVIANRIKLRQCLVRLRGMLFRQNNGAPDSFKPYAKRSTRFDPANPNAAFNYTQSQTADGWVHSEWFKGPDTERDTFSPATSIVLDCEDSIFAFEAQGNTVGQLHLPPGNYTRTHVCFLPNDPGSGASPNRDDYRNAAYIDNRTGITMHWGADARTFWDTNRTAWITKRNGFLTNGRQDFPFAHMPT